MSKLVLYHGSQKIVQKPVCGGSRPYTDFGPGFYCTEQIEAAKEWACMEHKDGYVNQYELEMGGLRVLDLTGDENLLLNWLALLITNRRIPITTPVMKKAFEQLQARFLPDLSEYDIVLGYCADDAFFSYVRAYIDDEISLSILMQRILMEKAEIQYVLKSQKAFRALAFRSVDRIDANEYSIKRKRRAEAQFECRCGAAETDSNCSLYEKAYGRKNKKPFQKEMQRTLAEAMDYAAGSCRLTLDEFMELFIAGDLAEQFAAGMPRYSCGMTGAELVCEVLETAGLKQEFPLPRISFTPSREYWCGWMLAYYQCMTGFSYRQICRHISMKEIEKLYSTLHKASDEKFFHILNSHMEKCAEQATRLQILRKAAGYSQKGLAEASGVNLRNIQQYEQRAKDINKGAAATVSAIARALGCRTEDLLEPVFQEENQ